MHNLPFLLFFLPLAVWPHTPKEKEEKEEVRKAIHAGP